MSEAAARACDGKRRHHSEKRADFVARATQFHAGIPMKSYPCEFCKGWHVGTVRVNDESEMRTSREQRKQGYTNYGRDRRDKANFGKIR
jgi:hypothetical protein